MVFPKVSLTIVSSSLNSVNMQDISLIHWGGLDGFVTGEEKERFVSGKESN